MHSWAPTLDTYGTKMVAGMGDGFWIQQEQVQEQLESPQSFLTSTAMRAWKGNRLGQVGEKNHKDVLVLTYQSTPVLGEWRKYVL